MNLKKIFILSHSDNFLAELAKALSEILPRYHIDTPNRKAAFIAQCAHESQEFTRLVENLNYSAEGLMKTFGSRISKAAANAIAHNQQAIGAYVYAHRNGNGDVASGEGYTYRGRGALQVTGRDNYERVGEAMGVDLISHPELLEQLPLAIESACVFWKENNLNIYADSGDLTRLTKRINGGVNGFEERKRYYQRALVNI